MMPFTSKAAALGALMLALAGCGDPADRPLVGERLDLRAGLASADETARAANKSVKIALGKPVSRSDWTHVGAGRLHDAGHNAFSKTPSLRWATPIGAGNGKRQRLQSDPVAAGGAVFTLDAETRVTAVSASTGAVLWSRDLTPPEESVGDASGGTLAVDGNTLYVTTGFGDLVALDRVSGRERWRQRLDAAGAAGLTVFDGLAYVVGADSRVWAIETTNGRVEWQLTGPASLNSRTGAASPVITDRLAVVPFASGDLYGVFRRGGTRLWSTSLSGQRLGVVYGASSEITGEPVVSGGRVFAGNQSGRFAAFDVESGARLWTAREGAYSPAVVAGGSVFFVSDQAELIRLSANDGARIWGARLPLFTNDNPRRRKDVFAHYGPVLAGERLWVASSDGVLRGFAPESGAQVAQVALPAPAASDPIVVGGVMYVLLADGRLAALN